MKLAEIYKLNDLAQAAIQAARDTLNQARYPGTSTIITGAPSAGSTSLNTVFSTTFTGAIFADAEKAEISGVLDMYGDNLHWNVFDVANVITQIVTFTGNSTDRYKLIVDVYNQVYNTYKDIKKFSVQLYQTVYFRRIAAAGKSFGGNGTGISF